MKRKMSRINREQTLPVLPIRNSVLFPYMLMPISVGRPVSIAAVQAAMSTEDKEVFVLTQRENAVESPTPGDLYTTGTKAVIKKMGRGAQGAIDVVLQGIERAELIRFDQTEPFLRAQLRLMPVPEDDTTETEAHYRATVELANRVLSLAQPQGMAEIGQLLTTSDDHLRVTYLLASMLSLDVEKEQALLEAATRTEQIRLLHEYLSREVEVLELRNKIQEKAQSEMSRQQREYLLRQQMQAIQQELGEGNTEQAEVETLQTRLDELQLPDDVRKDINAQLERLKKINPMSPDYSIVRAYMEFVLTLPWTNATQDIIDIGRARQILDEDHYGLEDVKNRILEHLGVLKLNPEAKAPILCFVGPPGVGKTSLGQSIARAMNRKFERMSLGGLHDEAELRGHRRTYIGAMPGRILKAISRAGVNNPVLMLDELDKIGRDFRGDPAAALLEVLDPEQNRAFRDNYLDLPFDLSRVFFVTTANSLDTIPGPLLDRMEVLRLSGYSEEEKLQIAIRYLIPRQLKEAGLTAEQLTFTPEALRSIISRYTREAGVRQLERNIGRIARKTALLFAEGKTDSLIIQPDHVVEMLGPERFFQEQARKQLPPGVATGLAWTEAGGDVLYVEATLLPEGRGLTLTGQLGDVMQESVKAAHSYLWANAERFGIDPSLFNKSGVHVHVPAGAIPKDGPSAGITMLTALASLYSGRAARSDTAMTGEITLSGLVLPVGGIKEKLLAARRAGIRRVVMPKQNERNAKELPQEILSEMQLVYVENADEVLAAVLTEQPATRAQAVAS